MHRNLSALLAVLALALAGCGAGGRSEPGRTATVPASAPIEVTGREYRFDPETLVIDTGGKQARLTIALKNDGALAHNLRVLSGASELGGTPTFQGGETRSGEVTLKPGSYQMVCTVGNHEQLGMKGRIEVR